jgi:hypothetical protein
LLLDDPLSDEPLFDDDSEDELPSELFAFDPFESFPAPALAAEAAPEPFRLSVR